MIDFAQDPSYLEWAQARLGWRYNPREVTWLTSLSKDAIVRGVVIFSRFRDGDCELTVVGDEGRWITKEFVFAVAAHVWHTLEQRRVTAIIAEGNEKSLNLAAQLGFRIEGHLRDFYPEGDAKILGLLRDECKFWGRLSGQVSHNPTA